MTRPNIVRALALLTAASLSGVGGYFFLRFTGEGGLTALDLMRGALVVLSGFWLVWGGSAAVMGVFVPTSKLPVDATAAPRGMTAILVPIYNEDPAETFARIAAMNRSLVDLGI